MDRKFSKVLLRELSPFVFHHCIVVEIHLVAHCKPDVYTLIGGVIMKTSTIHCQCGQRVKTREVLRTDLYERPNGKDYVYVKFRCRYCKQIGETFVPERVFSWEMFESPRDEMSDQEREDFAKQQAISSTDIVDFHQFLKNESATNLSELTKTVSNPNNTQRCDAGKVIKPAVEKKSARNKRALRPRGDSADS